MALKRVNYEIGDQGFQNSYEHSLSLNLRNYTHLKQEADNISSDGQQSG